MSTARSSNSASSSRSGGHNTARDLLLSTSRSGGGSAPGTPNSFGPASGYSTRPAGGSSPSRSIRATDSSPGMPAAGASPSPAEQKLSSVVRKAVNVNRAVRKFGVASAGGLASVENGTARTATDTNFMSLLRQGIPVSSSLDAAPGKVFTWGANDDAVLGHMNLEPFVHKPKLVDQLRGYAIVSAAVGRSHILFRSERGRVYAVGSGTHGQLGLGDSLSRIVLDTPMAMRSSSVSEIMQIEYLEGKNVVMLAAGELHSLALTDDGYVYSWGEGGEGQLGHHDTRVQYLPRRIEALKDDTVVHLSAGAGHSACITDDGRLYTWGWGKFGQLGIGDTNDQLGPRLVEFLIGKPVLQVECGESHTVALTFLGEVGSGDDGRLGTGMYSTAFFPRQVKFPTDNFIVRIACGDAFSVAISDTGKLFSWGRNSAGECGLGKLTSAIETPTLLATLSGSALFVDVVCGYRHALGRTDKGIVYGWGDGSMGQTGLERCDMNPVPQRIPAFENRSIASLAAGGNSSVAVSGAPLKLPPNVFACGSNQFGQLASEKTKESNQFVPILHLEAEKVSEISSGLSHTLAMTEDGMVFAWGKAEKGCLGLGKLPFDIVYEPRAIEGLNEHRRRPKSISCGSEHSLILTVVGDLLSFGSNYFGQLGHAHTDDVFVPTAIRALEGSGVVHAACGWDFCLAATDAGDVYAWGNNQNGQLGLGHTNPVHEPKLVESLVGTRIVKVAAGRSHSLALAENGSLFAWGSGTNGQTGMGDRKLLVTPRLVPSSAPLKITDICCGASHSVLLTDGGHIYTFGSNNSGRLGHGSSEDMFTPSRVEALNMHRVAMVSTNCTAFHTIAVTLNSTVFTWGFGKHGQLGNACSSNEKSPYEVKILRRREIVACGVGAKHTYIVLAPSILSQEVLEQFKDCSDVASRMDQTVKAGETVTRTELAQEELNRIKEQVARMKARNTELREQLDTAGKASRLLQGLDVDELEMKELDELKENILGSIRRVDIAKSESLEKSMVEEEDKQIAELEAIYNDFVKQKLKREKKNKAAS